MAAYREKEIQTVVERVVKEVTEGEFDTAIFDEISILQEYFLFTEGARKKVFPTFGVLFENEIQIVQESLKKVLLKELYDNGDANTFLKTYRIILALELAGLCPVEKIGNCNLKTRICTGLYDSQGTLEWKYYNMKTIALIDQI